MSNIRHGGGSAAFSNLKRLLRSCAVGLPLAGAALAFAPPGIAGTSWIQTWFSEGHTNANTVETTLSPTNVTNLQLQWGASVAGGATAIAYGAPENVIYAQGQGAGGSDPNLVAIDAASGATLWTVTTGNDGSFPGAIALGNGFVFAGCVYNPIHEVSAGAICAYGRPHGILAWRWADECNCEPPSGAQSSLVYSDNVLYVAYGHGGSQDTADEYLVALNAQTGKEIWTYMTGYDNSIGSAAPVVGNGMVYFGCSPSGGPDGVCALNTSNGSFVWSAGFGTTTLGLTLSQNVLYVNGGSANEVVALNATTGATLWTTSMASSSDPVSIYKGYLYVTGSDNNLYKLFATSGKQAASWPKAIGSFSSVSIANGVLYADNQGSNSPETTAYAVTTGAPLWNTDDSASTLHPPPIVANGVLYTTNGSVCGNVCAYMPED
jgi:outer membrane protein assembly factor BamB